ncbi:MAG: hypothetical protein SFW63_01085 [Alphaproteobacteria bacterium]|nr:hypothetical protein [Alphaproteobacteria bacterium]
MSILSEALPKQSLTPLQQAAVERIELFTREMAKKGIYVRSAMELEFTIMDEKGEPLQLALKPERIKEAERYLQQKIPHHIQRFGYECVNPETGVIRSDIKYEVNVIDNENGVSSHYNPLAVAEVTAKLKDKTLAEMLSETTCLNSPYPCFPNFAAHPYPNPHPTTYDEREHNKQSAGLHVNVSLYDAKGHNLFAESLNLRDQCLKSMLEIQRDALLMMMPKQNSLSRVGLGKSGINLAVPVEIKLGYEKGQISTALRDHDSKDAVRIENRLPGADADPYVAMAVTMAALYETTQKHVHHTAAENRQALDNGQHFVDHEQTIDFARYDIPDTYPGVIERFRRATRLKTLLGEKLYSAVIDSAEREGAAR